MDINFGMNGLCQIKCSVVALLPGTGNTSTNTLAGNTLASSQRSNLLSQRSTSLAQPIKAGFISKHPPRRRGGRVLWDRKWRRYKASLNRLSQEVLLWLRRLERWLEANVFVEVFPVPGSRATTVIMAADVFLFGQ
jgi:hypothetical protein